jgi:hypothetical protein
MDLVEQDRPSVGFIMKACSRLDRPATPPSVAEKPASASSAVSGAVESQESPDARDEAAMMASATRSRFRLAGEEHGRRAAPPWTRPRAAHGARSEDQRATGQFPDSR